MADNYLERKMEELRLGKNRGGVSRVRPTLSSTPGKVVFNFPPRHVLILGNDNGLAETIAERFLNAGSRVAVFDSDISRGNALAHDRGVRFCPLDLSDDEGCRTATENLLKAWRGIDIIINTCTRSESIREVVYAILEHTRRFPPITDYVPRIIRICHSDMVPVELHSDDTITATCINSDNRNDRDIAELAILVSIPSDAPFDGLRI